MPDDLRQKVQSDGTLVITPVQKAADAGVYTCSARNKQGHSARRSGEVTVIGKVFNFCLKKFKILYCFSCKSEGQKLFFGSFALATLITSVIMFVILLMYVLLLAAVTDFTKFCFFFKYKLQYYPTVSEFIKKRPFSMSVILHTHMQKLLRK